jgi:hypothetical protein
MRRLLFKKRTINALSGYGNTVFIYIQPGIAICAYLTSFLCPDDQRLLDNQIPNTFIQLSIQC